MAHGMYKKGMAMLSKGVQELMKFEHVSGDAVPDVIAAGLDQQVSERGLGMMDRFDVELRED